MNTKDKSKETILVLGSTGKTGSRVASRLIARGWNVRIGSRKADIPFDWENRGAWKAVLKDVSAVYVAYQPDLAVPVADEAIGAFARMAVENEVKKLVLISGRGEPEAQRCEEIIVKSGADWTIVRASWFMQNFSESYLLEPILAGYVSLPVGDIGEPFINVEDIADVAVAALTEGGHSNQVYEVTGPRLLTFKEAINEIAAATNRQIQYEQISIDKYTAMLEVHGVPGEYIGLLTYLFTEVLDGRNASLTNGVERALRRKPRDFSDYVRKTVEQGIWQKGVTLSAQR
jgi:uncharacterized protein YbjT (DUF2867 family)